MLTELAQIDGIDAVKQANSDELQLIDGLAVLAGNDDIYGRCLDIGGVGGICVASHVAGNEMRRMYDEPEARADIDASLQDHGPRYPRPHRPRRLRRKRGPLP